MPETLQIKEVRSVNRTESKSKRRAMRDVQIATFSAIETALYLDTHPHDKEAMEALKKYCAAKDAATATYEAEYGPISFCSCSASDGDGSIHSFRWALTPMPWENEDC